MASAAPPDGGARPEELDGAGLAQQHPPFFDLQRGIVLGYFADVPRYRDLALVRAAGGLSGAAA